MTTAISIGWPDLIGKCCSIFLRYSHRSLTGQFGIMESTHRNIQRFRNRPVHEFYGLKASQMSKVRASSHEYPHVEKSRIFGNRISKVRWPTTVKAKELTSRQKEQHSTTPRKVKIVHWVFFDILKCKTLFYERNLDTA